MSVIHYQNDGTFSALLKTPGLVVVVMWSIYHRESMMAKGVLETDQKQYKYTLITIDQENDEEDISTFLDSSVPCIQIFKDGIKIDADWGFQHSYYCCIGYNFTK
jgi:hypothetical protein